MNRFYIKGVNFCNMTEFISLISGSSGNATFISDGKTNILTDCGMSGKKLTEALSAIDKTPDMIDALLITHEHIDHVRGAGIIARRHNIPIYTTDGTHSAMDIGAVDDNLRHSVKPLEGLEIGTIGIMPFSIPHDAASPVGYCFFCNGKKYALATDIGRMNDKILNTIKGSESVILESNHDVEMLRYGTYPFPLKQRILSDFGHLSNEHAALAALELVKSGTKHLMLGHLSIENNRPEIAMLETYNTLTNAGVNVGSDVTLKVADRYSITKFGELI